MKTDLWIKAGRPVCVGMTNQDWVPVIGFLKGEPETVVVRDSYGESDHALTDWGPPDWEQPQNELLLMGMVEKAVGCPLEWRYGMTMKGKVWWYVTGCTAAPVPLILSTGRGDTRAELALKILKELR